MLGDKNGLELLKTMLSLNKNAKVIMITGYSSVDSAVTALKYGAYDYIPKPVKFEKILSVVTNVMTLTTLSAQNIELKKIIASSFTQITTRSSRLLSIMEKTKKLSRTNIPILIHGETGSGKELLAEFVHYNSERFHNKLHKVNCASFPENLLDNELFGHEKGAYTGADSSYKGLFERADGGTLFLDELGDMSISNQTKILRAIQNMEIQRIGGSELIKIDVRFVAATNKHLQTLVKEGRFREDLFFRLNAGTIHIPPLRERKEDIPILIHTFIDNFNKEYNSNTTISESAIKQLESYSWPGNVRELKNSINYACALAMGDRIELSHFPVSIINANSVSSDSGAINTIEKNLIIRTLQNSNNNKKKAADILGISRQALYNKIKRYNILTTTIIQD
jgi:DNA-binding NtrC family response regulator